MLEGHCRLHVCALATSPCFVSLSALHILQVQLLCPLTPSSSASTSGHGLENPEDKTRSPSPACCWPAGLSSKEEARIWPLSLETLIITSWKGLLFQVCKPALSIMAYFQYRITDGIRSRGENGIIKLFFSLVKATVHMEMSTVTGINISRSHL